MNDLARGAERSHGSSGRVRLIKMARQLRPSEIDLLVARYLATGSVAEVVREFGVALQTVGVHLASRGIETVRRMSADNITSTTELYLDGRSAATIGRQLGFDPQTVPTGHRKAGVVIRQRSGDARKP